MAITESGVLFPTLRDQWDASQIGVDLISDTIKVALFSDSITPNFGTDTAYAVAPYDANEVSGGSWSAGGVTLAGNAISTESVGGTPSWVFDATDVSNGATITSAMGILVYDDTNSPKHGICLIDLVTAVTVDGTLEIQWTAPGSGGILNQAYS